MCENAGFKVHNSAGIWSRDGYLDLLEKKSESIYITDIFVHNDTVLNFDICDLTRKRHFETKQRHSLDFDAKKIK